MSTPNVSYSSFDNRYPSKTNNLSDISSLPAAYGQLLSAQNTGILTDPQWGGADPTGQVSVDAALAAVTAANRTVVLPRGVFKITQQWVWNWWTNVVGTGPATANVYLSASVTGGSNILTLANVTGVSELTIGMFVSDTNWGSIASGTWITKINGASITLSSSALSSRPSDTFLFEDKGTTIVYAGPSGGTAVGTASLANVGGVSMPGVNAGTVAHRGKVEGINIVYNTALAPGACGMYVALPSGTYERVQVSVSGVSEASATCSTNSGSNTIVAGSAPSASIKVGMVASAQQIPVNYQVASCTTTSGSATVTTTNSFTAASVSSNISGATAVTGSIVIGQLVKGVGIPFGTIITAVSAGSITLSNAATASGTVPLLFPIQAVIGSISGGAPYNITLVNAADNSTTVPAISTSGSATIFFVTKPSIQSWGIWFDGCQNPTTALARQVGASGFWAGIHVATCILSLDSCQTAYCAYGIEVEQDSINSSSGPPYDVSITNFHAFHMQRAFVLIGAATAGFTRGGFNENAYGAQVASFELAPGALSGEWDADGPFTIKQGFYTAGSLPPILHYGASGNQQSGSRFYFNDPQKAWRTIFIGSGSYATGMPTRWDNLSVQRQIGYTGSYTTSSATYVYFGGIYSPITQGPNNSFLVDANVTVTAGASGATATIGICQNSSAVSQGSAISSATSTVTLTLSANQSINQVLRQTYGSQNTTAYFGIALLVSSGSVTLNNGVTVVTAY